jgi:predicted transport protein
LANTYPALKQITDIVSKKNVEDISMFYKSYLFGYTLKLWAEEENGNSQDVKNVKGVPPWCIGHCRLFTTDKDFAPFGKPMMMSAIPTYKSYKTTQLLVDMLRSQCFPREHYSIKCDENSDPFTRNMRISEAKNFLEGITPQSQNQDGLSVGAKIYSCEGLVDYELLDPSIDLDSLGDLEEKKYSMCMATGIPMTYLCPEEGDGLGGDNADKLYYLNKIFQRRVDALRRAFLETLDETYRMHLLLTNEFDGDKTEFELYIENPTEDYTSDKVSQISDIFGLAKDVVDTISTCAGLERGDKISPNIVKSVLTQYLPVEKDTINKWIDEIYGSAEEEENQNNDEDEGKPKDNMFGKKPNLFESRMKEKQIMEKCGEKINEEYFKFKQEHNMVNGRIGKKLYYNNTYNLKANYKNSTLALLNEQIKLNKVQRLKEQTKNK